MTDVQPQKALYYPHLDFGSSAWVKRALLYWDGIERLVAVAQPNDDREIEQLGEAGLISCVPTTAARDRATDVFGERLDDLLEQRGTFPSSIPRSRGLRGRRPDLVAERLESAAHDLERQGRRQAAAVVRKNPEQALAVYATVVAHEIAAERGLAVVTDDPMFSAIDAYFSGLKVGHEAKESPNTVTAADLRIPSPSVRSVAKLPVPRLLEIRGELAPQRRAFREKVEERARAIAQLPDSNAVREHMTSFADELREDLEAERAAMKRARLKDDWSLLSMVTPASMAVGMTIAQGSGLILAPLGGIGTLALGVTNWYVQRRQEPKEGGHYTLSLEHAVGGANRGLGWGLNRLLGR
jgi:hypothetical protein